jgi:hypothetical protein
MRQQPRIFASVAFIRSTVSLPIVVECFSYTGLTESRSRFCSAGVISFTCMPRSLSAASDLSFSTRDTLRCSSRPAIAHSCRTFCSAGESLSHSGFE